eukprot:8986296-Ditylum_brightwellii.AAC.1
MPFEKGANGPNKQTKKKENAATGETKTEKQGYKQGENFAGNKAEEKTKVRRDAAGRYQSARCRINSF